MPPSADAPPGEIPLSPRAKGTIDGAPRQALGLKDDYVGTEHLLLALLIERDSRTANVLTLLGCPPDLLRTTVLEDRKPKPKPAAPGLAPALADRAREVAAARGAAQPDAGDLLLALADRSPMLGRAFTDLGVTPRGAARRDRAGARLVTPARPRGTYSMPPRPHLALPSPGTRRAVVVGAGSFGTAVAVLLARGGFRTTLQTRTREQCRALEAARENAAYLPGVTLPRELRIEPADNGLGRVDYCFLGVPSVALAGVISSLSERGLDRRTPVISIAKGLVPPHGIAPTVLLGASLGASRVACIGGPAHAHEMVTEGAGLVAASNDARLAATISAVFTRAGVVCEQSSDPIGVELAGAAKNAAALAAGATQRQGLNAAGAAAGHIFLEVWRYAEQQGARPESMIGLAGTGDLVGTALAPQSRNRQAGELLAEGVPAAEIPERIGQAVEALDLVPLLANALARAHVEAPVTNALNRLIAGELPLEEWVAQVRATVPPPARFGSAVAWARWRQRMKARFARRR